jgi:hypothetical protein
MRKFLASLCIAVSAGVAPVVAAVPASAVPTSDQVQESARTDAVQPFGYWADVTWTPTLQDCIDIGEYGRNRGTWSGYDCSWHLYPPNIERPWLLRAFYN